jgi:hypothetical protein
LALLAPVVFELADDSAEHAAMPVRRPAGTFPVDRVEQFTD